MRTITQDVLNKVLLDARMKKKAISELRFVASADKLIADWSEYELVPIYDRTFTKGVLLLEPNDALYAIEFELSGRIANSQTGRSQSVICDFCYTWQSGTSATSITFTRKSGHSIRFLCCGDLACSMHVRSRTRAATLSRSQLREHITVEDRIDRLKQRLEDKILQLNLSSLSQ